jgi:hypothetical protein
VSDLLKDYKDYPQLKGVGFFIAMFGYGLAAGIMGSVSMLALRDHYLDGVGAPFIYRVQELTSRLFPLTKVRRRLGR